MNTTTLGALMQSNNSGTVRTYAALMGDNLGYPTIKLQMSIRDFLETSWVANRKNIEESEEGLFAGEVVAQRNLVPAHASGLAQYTLTSLINSEIRSMERENLSVSPKILALRDSLPSGPYATLAPLVCNIRACARDYSDIVAKKIEDKNGSDTGALLLSLSGSQVLWVVDGQHRRRGFEILLNWLKDITQKGMYPKKGVYTPAPNEVGVTIDPVVLGFWGRVLNAALAKSNLAIEVHLGLSPEEEQQLFVDLNNKQRSVQRSEVNSFDHSDPINLLIREELEGKPIFPIKISENDNPDWHNDGGEMSRKDIKAVCAFLAGGKGSTVGLSPAIVNHRKDSILKFWELIAKFPGIGVPGAKGKTILQQPVVLKALAKLCFDLAYGVPKIRDEAGLVTVFKALEEQAIDFSHTNPIWQALFLDPADRIERFPNLGKYIYVKPGTNLDAGTWDEENQWCRFGSRHNDIFPRIGDIIRCELKLKPRPTVTAAIEADSLTRDK